MTEEQSQITITYDVNEDRLLLRMQLDGKEVRAWLTRRMTNNLFGIVEKVFAHLAGIEAQPADQRTAVSQFRQDQALTKANFCKPYTERNSDLYFPEGPLLVTKVDFKPRKDGRVTIVLTGGDDQAQSVAFTMGENDLRAVMQLLTGAIKKAQWGIAIPQTLDMDLPQKPVVH